MAPLDWVVAILAISAPPLVARGTAAGPAVAVLLVLVSFLCVGVLLLYRHPKLLVHLYRQKKQQQLHLRQEDLCARQVNDSLYELHKPEGDPSMQILFFHGLPFEDFSEMHLSTWESEDGSCLWPKTWLKERFPDAHIFVVSYHELLTNRAHGRVDIYNVGENLVSDLIQDGIGQRPYCPVVLVGHSFGGLVIKSVCTRARSMLMSRKRGDKLKNFLDNIMGIFYYGTPHYGSADIGRAKTVLGDNMYKYFTTLSTERQRLNEEFNNLCSSFYPDWQTKGLGEVLPVEKGLFRGVVVVPEASAREGANFSVDSTADHFSITKPNKKSSMRFGALKELLRDISDDLAVKIKKREAKALQDAVPHNFQFLPEHVKGLEVRVHQVKTKLASCRTMGFVGMGGRGKTTLAKAAFNELASGFEYTCFVRDAKLIPGNERRLKEEVWKDMHCNGKGAGVAEEWFKLRGKTVLLVLDDISTSREIEVLLDIGHETAPKSRFIVTSRDRDLLNSLEDVHEVPFLHEHDSRELFMSHAFPKPASLPDKLSSLMDRIVKMCGGLPLTLEVLGKYLKGKVAQGFWEETLDALVRAEEIRPFDERLWAQLRPSYDGLGDKERQMFLDAVTFFSHDREDDWFEGWTLGVAKIAWSAAYQTSSVSLLWQTLVDRSLVYNVEEHESIKVHEQLLSMGRKIASEFSKSQCRVWERTEALRVVQSANWPDDKKYFAFQLRTWINIHVAGPAVDKFKHMVFLELSRQVVVDATGGDECLPSSLVLLKCAGPKAFNLALESRLVVLDLDLGDESLPGSIGQLSALRHLVLRNVATQTHMPEEVGHLLQLEKLILKRWESLASFPETFGNLVNLKILTLHHCVRLGSLPETFGNLRKLKALVFQTCNSLQTLPRSFGDLCGLEELEFLGCQNLDALPESSGNLDALRILTIDSCPNLRSLPPSFGCLSSLERLDVMDCEMVRFPESFGNLSALEHLKIHFCGLDSLPQSFGHLSALAHLELSRCHNLCALPESFGQLAKLQHLEIRHAISLSDIRRPLECLAQHRALHRLILIGISVPDIPDCINSMGSVHTLEIGMLPFVKVLPPWLESRVEQANLAEAPALLSIQEFARQDGRFLLKHYKRGWHVNVNDLLRLLHGRAMENVRRSDYEGAVREFECALQHCRGTLGFEAVFLQEREAVFLQERGIAKRLMGDLRGALEDLTSAFELVCVEENLKCRRTHSYDCLKHKGYVNFLLGDIDAAERDGEMALELLPHSYVEKVGLRSLAEEPVTYMHFKLKNKREDWELFKSAHYQVRVKFRSSDFQGALVIWDDLNARVFGYHDQAVFLRERGIIKSLLGDLHGALRDLTAAFEMRVDDYVCIKYRGYVKSLMGDLDGAQIDGTTALRLVGYYKSTGLGDKTVTYLHFRLKGSKDIRRDRRQSPHDVVMEKVNAADFSEALAMWDAFDLRVQGYYDRVYFFQERGILKWLAGDLDGALHDLAAALDIDPDDYECSKHQGFVKFLLGDIAGARVDAEKCVAMGLKQASNNCLGTQSVAFLEFTL